MPSTPEPSLEAPADPLPAPAASGDGAEAEPDEGSEPAEVTESIPAPEDFVRVADWIPDIYTDLRYAADNTFTAAGAAARPPAECGKIITVTHRRGTEQPHRRATFSILFAFFLKM